MPVAIGRAGEWRGEGAVIAGSTIFSTFLEQLKGFYFFPTPGSFYFIRIRETPLLQVSLLVPIGTIFGMPPAWKFGFVFRQAP
jgi:hypothetical protein